MKRTVAVIDGKGGGIGRTLVETIAKLDIPGLTILALGTNAQATTRMLSGGAHDGATGENAICHMAGRVNFIVAPMAVLVANAMMGEISPAIAAAIAASPARKLLLPMQRCGISVIGVQNLTVKDMMASLPSMLTEALQDPNDD